MTEHISEIINLLKEFQGIGEKAAERIVLQLLKWPNEKVEEFGTKIKNLPSYIKRCEICGNISESELCEICSNSSRNKNLICVIEEFSDIKNIEKSGFKGVYHVLNGKLSPLNNIGPDDINLSSLIARVESNNIEEVVLALDQDLEGEATSIYIANMLKAMSITVTGLGRGLPIGGGLSYANSDTISFAFNYRKPIL